MFWCDFFFLLLWNVLLFYINLFVRYILYIFNCKIQYKVDNELAITNSTHYFCWAFQRLRSSLGMSLPPHQSHGFLRLKTQLVCLKINSDSITFLTVSKGPWELSIQSSQKCHKIPGRGSFCEDFPIVLYLKQICILFPAWYWCRIYLA